MLLKSRQLMMAVCAVAVLAAGLETRADDARRTVTVNGTGKVSAVPDMARVTTGVTTQAETAGEALTANTAAMTKLFEVLKEAKIEKRDIQTSNFNVSPVYERDPQRRTNRVSGYRVSNQVNIRVRKIEELGDILDALVRAGSNQISGVSFDVENKSGIMDGARKLAVQDARNKAKTLCGEADVKVGKVLSISEGGGGGPRPQPMMARFAAAEAAVPVAAGEREFQAQVVVVFEIVD